MSGELLHQESLKNAHWVAQHALEDQYRSKWVALAAGQIVACDAMLGEVLGIVRRSGQRVLLVRMWP